MGEERICHSEVIRLYDEGETGSDIARRMGCTRQAVSYILKRAKRGKHPRKNARFIDWPAVDALLAKGDSLREVGRKLDIPKTTLVRRNKERSNAAK